MCVNRRTNLFSFYFLNLVGIFYCKKKINIVEDTVKTLIKIVCAWNMRINIWKIVDIGIMSTFVYIKLS